MEPFPDLDDHLVQPEITRDEIIGGRFTGNNGASPTLRSLAEAAEAHRSFGVAPRLANGVEKNRTYLPGDPCWTHWSNGSHWPAPPQSEVHTSNL